LAWLKSPRPSRQSTPPIALIALLLILVLTAAGAIWLRPRTENPAPSWSGTRLAGPAIAVGPRVSPDGKLLAFQALVDGNTQLALMNPLSGNWKVLTDDNSAGSVDDIYWSKDGTKIYFAREDDRPTGVYSIPALGGEPRLVLEDAGGGEPLWDGSLLIIRVNGSRERQLHRYWPDTGRLQTLNAIGTSYTRFRFRAFPDREEVVFYGRPTEGASANATLGLYILDLKNNTSRPVSQETSGTAPGGVNPLDGSIVAATRKGDLYEITAFPSNGRSPRRVMLPLTQVVCWGMDIAPDGALYVSQCDYTSHALRFKESAQTPTVMAEVPGEGGIFSNFPAIDSF
jgi:eukaryotic-like serine/threonine-protein kinase